MTAAAHNCVEQDKAREIHASICLHPFIFRLAAHIASVWASVLAKYTIPHRIIICVQTREEQKTKKENKERCSGAIKNPAHDTRTRARHMYIIFFSSTRTNII